MNIPSTVRTYLANSRGHFKGRKSVVAETFEASVAKTGIPLDKVVKAVLLKSGKAYLMAIVRGDQKVDIPKIGKLFQREFEFCSEDEIAELLPNCDLQALPPLAEPYGLRAIQDKSVSAMEKVYFSAGVKGYLICASSDDFAHLQQGVWQRHVIAKQVELVDDTQNQRAKMRKKVRQVSELPAMPGIAAELIRLKNNPFASANDLAAVIEQDPSLSAQLIRYATSPRYAQLGPVDAVESAIVRVLGMDTVQDIAFGLSLGKAFKNPLEGPIGLNAFWKHALYCAALTQALCNEIEFTQRPPAGMGYLAGLLHNFGILLLGHLFPSQFERLNAAMLENPHRSILDLEKDTIDVSHMELGMWLMEAWNMPREIIDAVRYHHEASHRSEFSAYANLVFIANALLKRYGVGDAGEMDIPADMLARFGLSKEQLDSALASVLEDQDGLEFMAGKMAA